MSSDSASRAVKAWPKLEGPVEPLLVQGWSWSPRRSRASRAKVGHRAGAEVPQVYVGAPSPAPPGVDFAEKQLAGFTRVVLRPGQATRVTVRIERRDLAYWSVAQHDWVVAGGQRTIFAGASSRDIRLRGQARVVR